tara:strand:+ start:918 stop:1388 length:471 start_codon:yes stop_codon:yes gene_type:complete
MYEFLIHTLVDITDNGNLRKEFPFKTNANELIHDRESLAVARNQNSNFNTMLQLFQMRGNITWERTPIRESRTIGNTKFGTAYEGKQNVWHFQFFTEQTEVYGDPQNPTNRLIDDFHLVPILNFCKETATFPTATFITQDYRTINTYFSYAGEYNK